MIHDFREIAPVLERNTEDAFLGGPNSGRDDYAKDVETEYGTRTVSELTLSALSVVDT